MWKAKYQGSKETECSICGRFTLCDPHHVFQGTARRLSDKYDAVIYLCRACHDEIHRHPAAYEWLKAKAQTEVMFRQGWSLEEWMQHFGKNYL